MQSQQKYFINPARELELLKKILVFERSWRTAGGNSLILGILYQKSNPISAWVLEDWLNLQASLPQEEVSRSEVRLVFHPVDLDSPEPLEASLKELGVKLVYLAPLELSTNPGLLSTIFKACEKLKVGTFTAVPEYLEAGAAIGFVWTGEKHQIQINLEAARAQGLNFSSRFLRLATVKKGHD
ncbi:MAG: YfiR family protein [Candidatus Saccharicenans sp.]|nr:YfiR family protein [Candidatus Saccharicenans sp.]